MIREVMVINYLKASINGNSNSQLLGTDMLEDKGGMTYFCINLEIHCREKKNAEYRYCLHKAELCWQGRH